MNIVQHHKMSEQVLVSLSETAKTYIKNMITKQKALGVYLHVNQSGCSGLSYAFDFVTEEPNNALKYENADEVILFVDKNSLTFLKGTVIDCVQEGLNKKLIFINPNAQNTCGCGESFSFEKKAPL